MLNEKKSLRKKFIALRKNLSVDERENLSQRIVQKFLSTALYKNSSVIMAYMSMADEIQLREFFIDAFDKKKILAIPLIIERGIIQPVILKNFDSLEVGDFGILTVKKNSRKFLDIEKIDCIIVPGAAFDIRGYRLGLGGGYYDRFLNLAKNAKKFALAFDFQVTENLPIEPHDMPVDFIITEKREIVVSCQLSGENQKLTTKIDRREF